jgi:hypothetical protein
MSLTHVGACIEQAMHKGDALAFTAAQACVLAVAHAGSASALFVGTRLVALPGFGFKVAVWSCTAVAIVSLLTSNTVLLLMERDYEYDVIRHANLTLVPEDPQPGAGPWASGSLL